MADAKSSAGPNRVAVDGTLIALADQLGDEHAALVQLLRSLADAVDRQSQNASLWREYRAAVADLGAITRSASEDAFADLARTLHSPVGDTAN